MITDQYTQKWQYSQSIFRDFHISMFNKRKQKPNGKNCVPRNEWATVGEVKKIEQIWGNVLTYATKHKNTMKHNRFGQKIVFIRCKKMWHFCYISPFLSVFFFASFFFYYYIYLFSYTRWRRLLPKGLVFSCFLEFCRIGEYISQDLFYCVPTFDSIDKTRDPFSPQFSFKASI